MYTHCIYRERVSMNTNIRKWGNSLALRIPNSVAKEMQVREGSEVELTVEKGSLAVKPAKKPKLSLARLVKGITAENSHPEIDWGAPVGKEVW